MTKVSDPIVEEDKKMRRLRIIVDLTAIMLAEERLTVDDALDLMNATRRTVLRLFPDKEETYDIIYGRRFGRIMRVRFGVADRVDYSGQGEEPRRHQKPSC